MKKKKAFTVTLNEEEATALKKFKTIAYRGQYELVYKVKPGYNWEPAVETLIIKVLGKVAAQARNRCK